MSDRDRQETASWDAGRVRRDAERTAPRRRRRRFPWGQYLLLVLVLSALLAATGWLLISEFCSFNRPEAQATVEVTSDDSLSSISDKLKDAGLIRYKWFFRLVGDVSGARDKIGIGSYDLNSDMDYLALITAMRNSSGNLNADTVRVTIPEGYTVAQTIALLASKGVNTEAALTEAAKTASFDYNFISSSSQDISRLEGYLFPDTYDFYLNEKASSALNRLLQNFARKSAALESDVTASGYSLKKIITIASLIEKETDGTDQAKIASVIYNRLSDTGSHGTYQKLQIDASLLYALPDHTGAITNEDKKVDSPYNLYAHEGLPPTPIANPGMDSIRAALHPETTSYYYYALGTDKLHHYFADYKEFQAFVQSDQYGG